MELTELTNYLDDYLKVAEIEDVSLNGLQVEGKNYIKSVAFAVDASMETFKKAAEKNADMIITHHGLLWNKPKYITGKFYRRIKFLIENVISLYSVHLPLDMHSEAGNNIQIAKMLKLNNIQTFGEYHGVKIGYKGELEKKLELENLITTLEDRLCTTVLSFKFNKEPVKNVGIVSGGAGSIIEQASSENLDLIITGETYHPGYHMAKEDGINLVFAGHYATETLGVKALAKHLNKKFGIKTFFIDVPTKM